MGLLKKTDASTLAREAIALAEENSAIAERTYRLVTTDVEAGQSIEVGVHGGGEVYAEVFSPSGDVVGTMSLIGADGTALESKSVAAPIAGELCGVEKYNFDRRNIASILEGGVSRGELCADTPCERLTDGIIDGYYGAVFVWCLTAGETPLERALESFCETILQPILARYTNT